MTGGRDDAFPVDEVVRARYRAMIDGELRDGERGRVLFVVSTGDLDRARGDLYVALGLAGALADAGWGVSFWPAERFDDPTPSDVDVAIVMLESYVPGLVDPSTRVIAWVRNWTESWAALPYLDEFAQLWCSSAASAARMREVADGPIEVVPLAADAALFHPAADGAVRRDGLVTTANFWGVERRLTALLEQAASRVRVTWFGTNARFLRLQGDIDHREAIDYFALPAVYGGWRLVVDDLIEAAAAYGNQNSRLFDAIAAGAIVTTNDRTGLDDLGLDEVPVYRDADDLVALSERFAADPDAADALAARLRAVVLERHTYAARAAAVTPMLEAAIATPSTTRAPLLAWSTRQRELLRGTEDDRAHWRTAYHDAADELHRLNGELADSRATLDGIRRSGSFRLAVRIAVALRPVRAAVSAIRGRRSVSGR